MYVLVLKRLIPLEVLAVKGKVNSENLISNFSLYLSYSY